MQKVNGFLSQTLEWLAAAYEQRKGVLLVVTMAAFTLTGIALFLWGTARYGIGIRTDSVDYLWSAKDLAHGIGLGTLDAFGKLKAMNHYPPLYPILLSPFEAVGIPGMVGARWVGAVLFGLLIILFGLILYRLCAPSFWFPAIGVLVLFFTPDLWSTTLYAMTEPLYLVCSLAGFLCLDNYDLRRKRRWMVLASLLFGMAFLTRYIGISVVAVGLLYLLLKKGRNVKSKMTDMLLMGAIAILPLGAWLIRNSILTGSATNRGLTFVPIAAEEWRSALGLMAAWINPIPGWTRLNLFGLALFALAALCAALILPKTGADRPGPTGLPLLLGLYACLYAVFVIIAKLLGDPTIPLNEARILFPLLSCLFFLLLYGFYLLQRMARRYSILGQALLAGLLIVLAGGSLVGRLATIRPYIQPLLVSRYNGLGLQNTSSVSAEFNQKIDGLPADTIYLTDDIQRLYFYEEKSCSYVGEVTPTDPEMIRAQSLSRDVAVVYFHASQKTSTTLQQLLPQLALIYQDSTGREIYFK
ncbi:MAG: glycosyltransferase family 39 protein [Anaerolineales bacterium]|jgi:hypothetical protein